MADTDDECDIATVNLGDTVEWTDERGNEWEAIVEAIDYVKRTLRIRGWLGKTNRQGGETQEIRRVPMDRCIIARRSW